MTAAVRSVWTDGLATALRVAADALDGGNSAQIGAIKAGDDLTITGLTALVQIVMPIERLLAGADPTILEDGDKLANLILDAVALAVPKDAPIIGLIELALSELVWLILAFKSGSIQVGGGMPPGWHSGPGGTDPIGNAGKDWNDNHPSDPSVPNPSGAIGG